MPKFLDAPSWYDSDGELREIAGYYSVGANSGAFQIPALSETSTFPYGRTFYVSSTPPGSAQVCISSSGYLTMTSGGAIGNVLLKAANGAQWLSNGTSGQVLTSNGNAAPSWEKLYTHLIIIGTSDSTSQMSGAAVFTVNNFSSEEYTREEIISFLETVKTQFEGGSSGSALEGLPCFFTWSTRNNSGEYLAPAGYVWAEDGVVYISGVTVMTSHLDNEPSFAQRTGSFTASRSYFQIFRDWVISAP